MDAVSGQPQSTASRKRSFLERETGESESRVSFVGWMAASRKIIRNVTQ